MFINKRDAIAAVITTAVVLTAAGGVTASALSSVKVPKPTNDTIYGCVSNSSNRTLTGVQLSAKAFQNEGGCPSGSTAVAFNATGTQVVPDFDYVATHLDFVGPKSMNIGEQPTSGSTLLDIGIVLPAGTYLATLNANASPNELTTEEVFPQFLVYENAIGSTGAINLFNVGSGALPPFISGASSQHDSFYGGSATFTIEQTSTLHVYAYGYNSDRSSGTYTLNGLTLTFVKETTGNSITPGS